MFGPSHLRVNEDGKIIEAKKKEKKPEPFDNLWAYRALPSERKLTGKGVTIAIADSGISSHPEFNGKNIQGQDFTLSGHIGDLKGHGTAVAGVVGARGVHFTGIAPDAKIIVYKIDDGSRLIGPQAAAAAVNTVIRYNEENPHAPISVLNLSYGVSNGGFAALSNAINRARETGVIVVCPAGNLPYPGVHYPANMTTTLAVGALASDGTNAYENSSYGKEVDFIAPGDRVFTAAADGGYALVSGTSVASGFVTGAAAIAVEGLKKQLGRFPTADEVLAVLRKAAVKLPHVPDAKQGNGVIDIKKLENSFSAK